MGILLAIPILVVSMALVVFVEMVLGHDSPGPRLHAAYCRGGEVVQWLIYGPSQYRRLQAKWMAEKILSSQPQRSNLTLVRENA